MQDTYVVSFNAPEIASAAQPGQFVMIKCGSGHQPLWRRPLSLHRVNRETGEVALLYALAGQGTRWLSSRRPGETVDVLGPLGHGFELPAERKSLLLVAGGRGIAPLAFLAEEALAQGCPVTLLHGAASASCLSDHATLPDGVRVVEATEDGSRGENGLATQVLPRLLPGKDLVYACGPMGMYRAMASLGLQVPVQVLVETPMACGFGGCYGCAVRTVHGIRLACKDGPCFRLDELMW
ncbi:MAG: dihydroorotate dehydrogenase electron transfer subunit [Chloroflexi bacterium]|nr:dihydroorotate dehydrogenase electron transfer subunit [Chloroflexota bacterium]